MQGPERAPLSRPWQVIYASFGRSGEMPMKPEALATIDERRRKQPDLPSCAEAIRRLVELWLKAKRAPRR